MKPPVKHFGLKKNFF